MSNPALSKKQINLVDGQFTKSQALLILTSLIDQKINYHKIEGMQKWETDHNVDNQIINNRIDELKQERANVKTFIKSLTNSDAKLKIHGVLSIEVIE